MSFFENTRKPVGFGVKIMVSMMNIGHRALAAWGMAFLNLTNDAKVLDCGCGGGANIRELLEQAGFARIQVHKNQKGWLCVTAGKEK